MTSSDEDRLARLQAQVTDLSELVLTLGGRCMALEVAATNAILNPGTGIKLSTADLLDCVYATLLATSTGAPFLEGFHETAEAIRTARDVVEAVTGGEAVGRAQS